MIKLPRMADLYNAYPKPYKKPTPNCTQKKANGDIAFENQCAIRLSMALIKCGYSFKNYTDPKCDHGHARGARSLASFIWRESGVPKKLLSNISVKGISTANGIIYFHNLDGNEGNDHIDILYKGITQAESAYSNIWTAVEYWYFPINY